MHTICRKYDKYDINMQEICRKYARNMHEKHAGNMLNMQEICMKYARNMHEIFMKYGNNMQEICKEIWKKYDKYDINM